MIISPKQLFWHVLIIKQYEGKYAYIHTYEHECTDTQHIPVITGNKNNRFQFINKRFSTNEIFQILTMVTPFSTVGVFLSINSS